METYAYVRKQNTKNTKLQISKISYITSCEPDSESTFSEHHHYELNGCWMFNHESVSINLKF